MRTIVVGDIHGCLQEFDELMRVVELHTTDRLVLVGDLINKGPDSLGVVRRARERGALLVRGNHEERFLSNYRKTGMNTYGLSEDDLWYFRKAYLHMELPELGAVVVHGGIPQSLTRLVGPEDPDYRLIPTLQSVGGQSWAWGYDGRFGHAYFGHQPFMLSEPARFPHATGLDLGCCLGGHLCAAILQPGVPRQFAYARAHRAKEKSNGAVSPHHHVGDGAHS